MDIRGIKFDWLSRLVRVVFIFLAIIAIPLSFFISSEWLWGEPISVQLFFSALYLLAFYLFLILIIKTTLYIAKGQNFLTAGFNKKRYMALGLPIVLSLLVALVFGLIVEPIQLSRNKSELESSYSLAIGKIDRLKTELNKCVEPIIEKKYQDELRSCNLRKNKIKHDYNFCVSLTSIESPASCLYSYDYEKIDCSEPTLKAKAWSSLVERELSASCQEIVREYKDADLIISNYNLQGQ